MNKQIVYPQALEMAFIDCPFDWSTKPREDGIAREVVIGIERDGDDQYFICAGGHHGTTLWRIPPCTPQSWAISGTWMDVHT